MADLPAILIVDDEVPQMQALCDTLRDRGYETVGFARGALALDALRQRRFDLLLSDLMMPEMDGIALLQSALAIDPDLVGIIMTGAGTIASAVDAMKSGALDYILKPFKLSEIIPVLSRALAVRQLRLEKAELERCVKERTAELERANQELKTFSYSVSHDLRAPLRIIAGFANILSTDHAGELSADAMEVLSTIVRQAGRMEGLIEGLLRFSQLGRQALRPEPLRVSLIVDEVLAELKSIHRDRGVAIVRGEIPDAFGDPQLIRQVWANLLSNAFKYTAKTASAAIEVGARSENGEVVYFVRDNGVGFRMTDVGKLFQVFKRLHAQSDFEGNGIGLSIVQRIIERHGGRIWAEAAPQQGAMFSFTLQGAASPSS